jgi:putative flippase GtrA
VGYDYKAIIIDVNHGDAGNESIAHRSESYQPGITLHHSNGSLAATISRSLAEDTADIVILMDASQQAWEEILPAMVKSLESNDLVVASSESTSDSIQRGESKKKLTVRITNWLTLPLAPKVEDRRSWFFGFKRVLVDPTSLSPSAADIGLEIIAQGHFKSVAHIRYRPAANTDGLSSVTRPGIWSCLPQIVRLYLSKFQLLNFMVVGGIGYAVNMLIYWPLTLLFKTQVKFLGQQFFLPPFVISSLVAIICNYELNKIWTFKGWKEQRLGGMRYFLMAAITLIMDMAMLSMFVDIFNVQPVPAAALAILVVFIVRYLIARRWIWSKKS